MGLFDDFRRGIRTGRAAATGRADFSSPSRHEVGGFDDFIPGFDPEGPGAFGGGFDLGEQPAGLNGGDELAECKTVIAGLLAEKEGVKAQLEQWAAAVAERDEYIRKLGDERNQACAERDRYQDNGKRTLDQLREVESIIAFPGAKRALEKVLHPDTGEGGTVADRTAAFQVLMAVCARLGIK